MGKQQGPRQREERERVEAVRGRQQQGAAWSRAGGPGPERGPARCAKPFRRGRAVRGALLSLRACFVLSSVSGDPGLDLECAPAL